MITYQIEYYSNKLKVWILSAEKFTDIQVAIKTAQDTSDKRNDIDAWKLVEIRSK